MFDKFKQLMEMKKQADQIKKELDGSMMESSDIRGLKIMINGSQEIKSIEIDTGVFKIENKENFERDLVRSVNAAIRKSQVAAAQKMKDLMPGMPNWS